MVMGSLIEQFQQRIRDQFEPDAFGDALAGIRAERPMSPGPEYVWDEGSSSWVLPFGVEPAPQPFEPAQYDAFMGEDAILQEQQAMQTTAPPLYDQYLDYQDRTAFGAEDQILREQAGAVEPSFLDTVYGQIDAAPSFMQDDLRREAANLASPVPFGPQDTPLNQVIAEMRRQGLSRGLSPEEETRIAQERLTRGGGLETLAEIDRAQQGADTFGSLFLTSAALAGAGAPLAGAGLLPNVVGRGSLSMPQYILGTAGGELGAVVGGDVAGTPGALLGGLAGGLAGAALPGAARGAGRYVTEPGPQGGRLFGPGRPAFAAGEELGDDVVQSAAEAPTPPRVPARNVAPPTPNPDDPLDASPYPIAGGADVPDRVRLDSDLSRAVPRFDEGDRGWLSPDGRAFKALSNEQGMKEHIALLDPGSFTQVQDAVKQGWARVGFERGELYAEYSPEAAERVRRFVQASARNDPNIQITLEAKSDAEPFRFRGSAAAWRSSGRPVQPADYVARAASPYSSLAPSRNINEPPPDLKGTAGLATAGRAAPTPNPDDSMAAWEYTLKRLEGAPDPKAEAARLQQINLQQQAQRQANREAANKARFSNTGKARTTSIRDAMEAAREAIRRGETGAVEVPAIKLPSAQDIKLTDELTAALGIPRTIKASFDFSAPGRQGLALAFRHPKEWAESWVPMVKAFNSEEGMQAVNKTIGDMMAKWGDVHPHFYEVGQEAEALSRAPGFEPQGKGIISGALRKIPLLEPSERGYATFLNYQRAKTFDTMATALKQAGETNPQRFKNLANIIDHATGWGGTPTKDRLVGQALFSQRYTTSRFQFLADPIVEGLMRRDLGAAKAATENLVAFAGGMAGLLTLGHETGLWDAELDPRSSDFGKVRIGPQRIDFGAGFLPLIRTAARIATGEGKATTGEVYEVTEKNEFLKYFRNKLAPIPSEVITRLVGENPVGEKPAKVLSLDMARNLFMPLLADAVVEAYGETGNREDALRALAAELVGGGTSTYGSGQVMQVELAKEQFGKEYDSLYAEQQAALNRQIAEAGTNLPYRDRQGAWWEARDDALARWHADLEADVAEDPFVQQALKLDRYADVEQSLVDWARKAYEISRVEAEAAVTRFLKETRLDDYVKAYRKDVLAADPGFLQSWDEAYEKGDAEFAPPKWAREFVAELSSPVGSR